MDETTIFHMLETAVSTVRTAVGKDITGYEEAPISFVDEGEFDYLGRKFCIEIDYFVFQKKATISTYELLRDTEIRGQINMVMLENCTILIGIHEHVGKPTAKFESVDGQPSVEVFLERRLYEYRERINAYLGKPQ